jgi:hypothetical protein
MTAMAVRPPAVTCHDCGRSWNSATLVEGLRLLGSCPRCGGTLEFREDDGASAGPATPPQGHARLAPHLVLGIPRR